MGRPATVPVYRLEHLGCPVGPHGPVWMRMTMLGEHCPNHGYRPNFGGVGPPPGCDTPPLPEIAASQVCGCLDEQVDRWWAADYEYRRVLRGTWRFVEYTIPYPKLRVATWQCVFDRADAITAAPVPDDWYLRHGIRVEGEPESIFDEGTSLPIMARSY